MSQLQSTDCEDKEFKLAWNIHSCDSKWRYFHYPFGRTFSPASKEISFRKISERTFKGSVRFYENPRAISRTRRLAFGVRHEYYALNTVEISITKFLTLTMRDCVSHWVRHTRAYTCRAKFCIRGTSAPPTRNMMKIAAIIPTRPTHLIAGAT